MLSAEFEAEGRVLAAPLQRLVLAAVRARHLVAAAVGRVEAVMEHLDLRVGQAANQFTLRAADVRPRQGQPVSSAFQSDRRRLGWLGSRPEPESAAQRLPQAEGNAPGGLEYPT